MDAALGFAERLLTSWGPLALGWPLFLLAAWGLWRVGALYVEAARRSGEGAEGMAATLESLEASTTHALGQQSVSIRALLDGLEDLTRTVRAIDQRTADTHDTLQRATRKRT